MKTIIYLKSKDSNILYKYFIVNNTKFHITQYLGKGSVGQVYLIQHKSKKYVIKISNYNCYNELLSEADNTITLFNKYNIIHNYYPIYWGDIYYIQDEQFINSSLCGVIYPFLGFYNLENIKQIDFKLNWNSYTNIIKQLLNQLSNFNNIIHGDLKSSNVVFDIYDYNIIANIIDFGLIKDINNNNSNIISTNYVTSPESLFTTFKYSNCIVDTIDYSKHDYFGLYVIILDLFLNKLYWYILSSYLIESLEFNSLLIRSQRSTDIITYMYYKFFNIIPNNSYSNLISSIEKEYNLSNKNFITFEQFFKKYIKPNLNFNIFPFKKIPLFYNFLISICHFNPSNRLSIKLLLQHPFIN
jgi:serine/threonine protein kinase